MKKTAAASVLAAFAAAGCAQTTSISTRPEGARVYVDGKEVCAQTPCAFDSRVGLPRRYHLQLRKAGFREVDLYVDRELSVTWWLASIVMFSYASPLLGVFSYEMQEALSFQLEGNGQALPGQPYAPPGQPYAPPGQPYAPQPAPAAPSAPPSPAAPPMPPAPPPGPGAPPGSGAGGTRS